MQHRSIVYLVQAVVVTGTEPCDTNMVTFTPKWMQKRQFSDRLGHHELDRQPHYHLKPRTHEVKRTTWDLSQYILFMGLSLFPPSNYRHLEARYHTLFLFNSPVPGAMPHNGHSVNIFWMNRNRKQVLSPRNYSLIIKAVSKQARIL